jgi:hypothetical protein
MSKKRKPFVSDRDSKVAEIACDMLDSYWTLYLRDNLPLALSLVDVIKEYWAPCVCDPVMWYKDYVNLEHTNLHLHFSGCRYAGSCLVCQEPMWVCQEPMWAINVDQHGACLRSLRESVRQ